MRIEIEVYPVPESMPDFDTDVLIWREGSLTGELGAYLDDKDHGQLWVDANGGVVESVTHWADLPQRS
jgi:hypothetical protein